MGDAAEATTTAGAASFDDFSVYFVRFLIVAVWIAYAMPIFEKIVTGKPWKWTSKLETGWKYISGPKATINKSQ